MLNNIPDFTLTLDESPVTNERKRVCCNCGNNMRIKDSNGMVCENRCSIDNHRISYTACFEHWCNHWCKEKKEKGEITCLKLQKC